MAFPAAVSESCLHTKRSCPNPRSQAGGSSSEARPSSTRSTPLSSAAARQLQLTPLLILLLLLFLQNFINPVLLCHLDLLLHDHFSDRTVYTIVTFYNSGM
jgi:hypothetical protein